VTTEQLDLVIVGGGPAGLSAAGHARDNGLSCVLLERADHLADTVYCYQKKKHVMAEPSLVPLRSPLGFEAGTREEVLGAWDRFADEREIDVRLGQEVVAIERTDGGGDGDGDGAPLVVRTASGAAFSAPRVVLAIGTQGNPRLTPLLECTPPLSVSFST
jgi:thioredoxin reductase